MASLPALLRSFPKTEKSARIFLSAPHMCGKELGLVHEAFESNYIAPVGPMVDKFERVFCEQTGIPHAVALSSGTAAIHLALRYLNAGPGDTVMASTLTFIGSVSPILFQGAKPIFIDSDRKSWNMDPDLLEEALFDCQKEGALPRAVIPTDLYGQCADYDRMIEICESYSIPLIVDAAEALGARYRKLKGIRHKGKEKKVLSKDNLRITTNFTTSAPSEKEKRLALNGARGSNEKASLPASGKEREWVHAGVGASAAIYSFNGNKILTTSGGGMLASNDKDFIEKARYLSQQAREPFAHYEHIEIGYNYRMSNILAAIGLGQLHVLEERIQRKREIFGAYQQALGGLPGIEFMPEPPHSRSNRWLSVILITPEEFGASREEVRLALEAENIESRPVWKPMHMQPVFDCVKFRGSKLKARGVKSEHKGAKSKKIRYLAGVVGGDVAEDLFNRGLCLPSGTAMTEGDLDRVIHTIRKCHN